MQFVNVTPFELLYLVLHLTAMDVLLELPVLTPLLKLSLSGLHTLAQELLTSILQAILRYCQCSPSHSPRDTLSHFLPAQSRIDTEMKHLLTAHVSAMEQVRKRVTQLK